jgi:hypothetical protein
MFLGDFRDKPRFLLGPDVHKVREAKNESRGEDTYREENQNITFWLGGVNLEHRSDRCM